MSCHGCATKFNIFKKENGCPICGFSYCGKCLKYKTVLQKLGTSSHLVCKACYNRLENQDCNEPKLVVSASEDFVKTLDSLENPAKPPIVVYLEDQRLKGLKYGLNEVDREILNRLEKLKKDRKQQPAPNEEEIARRLASLKGQDPDNMETISKKEVHITPDTRSDVEKTNDLMKQLLEEKALASKLGKPEEEIAKRLTALRDEASVSGMQQQERTDCQSVSGSGEHMDNSNDLKKHDAKENSKDLSERCKNLSVKAKMSLDGSSSDEEEIAEGIIKRAFDEASLPSVETKDSVHQNEECSVDMDSQLPWCIICNEDATKRCHGCDDDLYCDRCYAEGHDVWNMKGHKTSPFKPLN